MLACSNLVSRITAGSLVVLFSFSSQARSLQGGVGIKQNLLGYEAATKRFEFRETTKLREYAAGTLIIGMVDCPYWISSYEL